MTDTHLHILRILARRRRNELSDHDAAPRAGRTASDSRRRHLQRAVTKSGAQVTQAEARRRRAGTTPVPLTPPREA